MTDILNNIHNMDCMDAMKLMAPESVNLIVTSPPYADQRKATYGGTHPDKYVEWFLPIADEFYRILVNDGSFVLNIKEKVVNGERHPYVMNLIIKMREKGWFYTEEYIWHKKTSSPGKWPNRFRDAWERCIHFTKQQKFKMNQDIVKVQIGEWATPRLKKLSENDQKRTSSATNSGFGKNLKNWVDKNTVYPTNVLHLDEDETEIEKLRRENEMLKEILASNFIDVESPSNVLHLAPECGNKHHSASFPVSLPTWFIKLFTNKHDVVFDPFLGSGTTVVAAMKLNRQFIGTEIHKDYFNVAMQRIYNKPLVKDNLIVLDCNDEDKLPNSTEDL